LDGAEPLSHNRRATYRRGLAQPKWRRRRMATRHYEIFIHYQITKLILECDRPPSWRLSFARTPFEGDLNAVR
jgi:hypothetical protein